MAEKLNTRTLVIDLGNTAAKCAVFEEGHLRWMERLPATDLELLSLQLETVSFDYWILSSVLNRHDSLLQNLNRRSKGFVLSHQTPVPLILTYKTPETLGLDRLANAVAAWRLFQQQAALIIDAGTCIKYDVVLPGGIFPGGAISPGLQMRFNALHTFTEKLPAIQIDMVAHQMPLPVTGQTTRESLIAGVLQAAVFEAEGFIAYYTQLYPQLNVILTGGDAPLFESRLKNQIFAVPDLTLQGLQAILEYQLNAT